MGLMDIRPLAQGDLAGCVRLFVDVFTNEPWNESWAPHAVEQRLREIHQTPGFVGVVACEADRIVGFALGNTEPWKEKRHFCLKEMCVQTTRQRQGIGTAIMHALLSRLKEADIEKAYLLTARESQPQAFYAKCGFYVSPKMIMMGKYLSEACTPR